MTSINYNLTNNVIFMVFHTINAEKINFFKDGFDVIMSWWEFLLEAVIFASTIGF